MCLLMCACTCAQVLNSLAGDALAASMELLRPFGRLVELGKRDAYEGRTT